MIKIIQSLGQRLHKEQSGQMLVMTAVSLMLLFAIACMAVDVAKVYLCYRQLKASTDAAAMAAAGNLSNPGATTTTITNMANYYSSVPGNQNAFNDLGTAKVPVAITVTPKCITGSTATGVGTAAGIACVPLGSGSANAVQITQTAVVPLTFAGLFGVGSVTLTAHSAASIRGGAGPYNVAIIMDTTKSMGSGTTDSCTGKLTPIECAQVGLQTLLSELSPCMPGTGGSNCIAADSVSLFTFPAVTQASASAYYCSGSPTTIYYWSALAGPGDTQVMEPATLTVATKGANNSVTVPKGTAVTYQITPFLDDYRTSDSSTSLSTTSDLVKASGTSSSSTGCLSAPGGAGTYYAGVIYAAQDALAAQQKSNPNTQNVLIILTDGNATATASDMLSPYNVSPSTTYMSTLDTCQQAIKAAQTATKLGTTVYAVGFGSESSGCVNDTTSMGLTGLPAGVSFPGANPCQVIESMASKPQYWFTDQASKDLGCTASSQPYTNMKDIFTAISAGITTPKLIPYSTT